MTSSHHGPYGLGYTRATMVGTKGRQAGFQDAGAAFDTPHDSGHATNIGGAIQMFRFARIVTNQQQAAQPTNAAAVRGDMRVVVEKNQPNAGKAARRSPNACEDEGLQRDAAVTRSTYCDIFLPRARLKKNA